MRISKSQKVVFAIALVLLLGTMACVRTLPADPGDEKGPATDSAAETKDAAVQMTLASLLGTATVEIGEKLETAIPAASEQSPDDTEEPVNTAGPTVIVTTNATSTNTNTPTPTVITTETPIAFTPCYEHRFVYDETYPDGTRVDPGEDIEKTWRLQNVGTCDWDTGKYQMVFVSGAQMGGSSLEVIQFTVLADGYANFSVDLTAPDVPGTYVGYWILETTNNETIGWGPDADQPFYIEIQVRGDTPTPTSTP